MHTQVGIVGGGNTLAPLEMVGGALGGYGPRRTARDSVDLVRVAL